MENMLTNFTTVFIKENNEFGYPIYLLLFVVSWLLTFVFTFLLIKILNKCKLYDMPNQDNRRVHSMPIPRLGGLAIFLAVALTLALAAFIHPVIREEFFSKPALSIFAGLLIMLGLGICDDIWKVSWPVKFAVQIVATCIVIAGGVYIERMTGISGVTLQLIQIFGFIFTFGWIIGITNAINLSDGLDGLSSGITLIVVSVIFINSIYLMNTRDQQFQLFVFSAVCSIVLIGATLAFLHFNFFPAKIFLGDTGSLFIGFFLACIAIKGSQMSTTTVALTVPVIALGLPILDTTLAFMRRSLKAKNPFKPDMQHIHHKVMLSGLSHPKAVLILYTFCFVLGLAALIMSIYKNQFSVFILVILIGITLIFLRKYGIIDITKLWGNRRDNFKGKKR